MAFPFSAYNIAYLIMGFKCFLPVLRYTYFYSYDTGQIQTKVRKEKILDTYFVLCYSTQGDKNGNEVRTGISL